MCDVRTRVRFRTCVFRGGQNTYNTPTLIANAMPIFSRLYMRKDRSILQGRRASRKSHAAE